MALDAMIFDLDGTLLDSNDLHVRAWESALKDNGFEILASRLKREIGKGGDQLLPSLLGEIDAATDQKLRDAYAAHIKQILQKETVQVLAGARELLGELKNRGLKLALATSSKSEFLALMERSSDWNFQDEFDVVVTSSDAEKSKPAPDVISVALEKLGLSPAQCAFVGDTIYDAQACRGAGVVCFGVLSSGMGVTDAQLREAGAREVWDDCAAILDNLDDALQTASPNSLRLDSDAMKTLMQHALQAARDGVAAGEAPIGCVLARGNGKIIAQTWNQMNATQMKTAHAEIMAFREAAGKAPLDAKDLILISTLEPCVMCLGAAMEAGVDTIIYALEAPYDSGTQRVAAPRTPESQMPRIIGGIERQTSRELFEDWYSQNAETDQAAFVKLLLEGTAKD